MRFPWGEMGMEWGSHPIVPCADEALGLGHEGASPFTSRALGCKIALRLAGLQTRHDALEAAAGLVALVSQVLGDLARHEIRASPLGLRHGVLKRALHDGPVLSTRDLDQEDARPPQVDDLGQRLDLALGIDERDLALPYSSA